jgi:hypothetical protein
MSANFHAPNYYGGTLCYGLPEGISQRDVFTAAFTCSHQGVDRTQAGSKARGPSESSHENVALDADLLWEKGA